MLDSDGRFLELNPAWETRLGWRPDDLVGRRAAEFIHPGDAELGRDAARQLLEGGRLTGFEHRFRAADGSHRWLSWNLCAGGDGRIYGVAEDVSELKMPELGGPLNGFFYRHLVESCEDAIITKNSDAVITSWNDAATRMYGYTCEEAVGRPVSLIVPPDHQGEEFRILATALKGERMRHYETQRVAKDGRRLDVSLSVSPIRGEDGEVVGAATVARDITERKRMERQLRHLAHHDPLTGIYNRARFREELKQWLRHSRRYGRPGAVLVVDLDGFKLVNDTRGHAVGDALLQKVAATLREHVRESDVVGRMGGDEFAVLLTEIDADEAMHVAEKLLHAFSPGTAKRGVSASIGVAPFDGRSNLAASDLMIAADAALYEAKNAGKNRAVLYSADRPAGLECVEQIRAALDRGHLRLEGQPIIDLRTGEITHHELLVRMLDETGGLIPPVRFLPTAERFGLIQEVDRWVIGQAIALAAEGRDVTVNVSGNSVGSPALMGPVLEQIQRSGIDPRKLVFEITETAAVANMNDAYRFACDLAELGCSFALDDFGTGFGGFSYLKRMPLKYLKIDRSFTGQLTTDGADRHVIEALVSLARAFGIQTIAEGVESEATLKALPGLGVDQAQGFYIGRPAPVG